MKLKKWDRLFEIEVSLGIIIALILASIGPQFKHELPSQVFWLSLVILVAILVLKIFSQKNQVAKLAFNWLSILSLVFVSGLLINSLVSTVNIRFSSLTWLSSCIGLILLLVVNIPMVVINYPVANNWWLRLIAIAVFYFNYVFGFKRMVAAPAIISKTIWSGLADAIALFILAFFIAKAWGLKFSWNLKLIKNKDFHWLTLLILLAVGVWFAFFNTYVILAQSLRELLCFWQWDFSMFEITSKAVIQSSEAGILEETMRALELMILLYAMRKYEHRVVVAVVATSVLFALGHLSGLEALGVQEVLQQVVCTFGSGMLLAVIYLYSGKLWLSLLLHSLVDLVSFSITPLSYTANPLITSGWVEAVILLMVPLIISLVMMWGKRRRVMEDHVDQIVGM